jgi:hypothetical protein
MLSVSPTVTQVTAVKSATENAADFIAIGADPI